MELPEVVVKEERPEEEYDQLVELAQLAHKSECSLSLRLALRRRRKKVASLLLKKKALKKANGLKSFNLLVCTLSHSLTSPVSSDLYFICSGAGCSHE